MDDDALNGTATTPRGTVAAARLACVAFVDSMAQELRDAFGPDATWTVDSSKGSDEWLDAANASRGDGRTSTAAPRFFVSVGTSLDLVDAVEARAEMDTLWRARLAGERAFKIWLKVRPFRVAGPAAAGDE